ncbi:MAG: sodium:solute symporter family protein [Chitinivibrionia bacterium]|nr:sodium:solute symporter family protein [Chitinivibrionia bacterium]
MILAFTLIYAAILLAIGLLKPEKRDAESYFVLGRALTLPAFVATLVSTWYGGILGIGEYSYRYGISNWLVFGVPYYLAAFVFAMFLAKKARQSRYYTIPDLLFRTYGRNVSVVGAFIIFFMTVPGAYVLMLGVLIHELFGISLVLGILIGTLFSVAYTYRGGLGSVVRIDIVQFVLMFLSFMCVVIFLLVRYGGLAVLAERLPATHLTWHGGNRPQYVLVWYVIALATLVEPAFYQRCFAARSEAIARKGVLISILFWIAFDAMTTTTGLFARALLPDLVDPANAFPALAVEILPPALGALLFLGMLVTVHSTVDSYAFISANTLGRDIVWRLRGGGEDDSRRLSAWGLVISGAVAAGFAVWLKSVVDIWHHFGSVGTPALLFPLVSSFSRIPVLRPGGVLAMMICGGGLSLFWLLSPALFPGLGGEYLLGIEPIFPGLILSGGLYVWFRHKPSKRSAG